jgi:hypothetical protein
VIVTARRYDRVGPAEIEFAFGVELEDRSQARLEDHPPDRAGRTHDDTDVVARARPERQHFLVPELETEIAM